jgi:hypothetical protein
MLTPKGPIRTLGTEDWMLTAIYRLLEVSADAEIVGVEVENLFSSFIARPVMSFVVMLHY